MNIWLKVATTLEYGILVLLFVLSIWSFAIMIDRRRVLKNESKPEELLKLRSSIETGDAAQVRSWVGSHPGMHASALKAVGEGSTTENVDRIFRSHIIDERLRLEKGLPVLATLGSNTPFIGLFGTVLGIIRAFAALGETSGQAGSVMSGISQALVATAAGLFVAIPAVVAFNSFSTRVRVFVQQSESLKDLYVARVRGKG